MLSGDSAADALRISRRAKRYYEREQILALGETAHAYLTEVVHRRPERWMADVERLFELLQHHGEPAMREAELEAEILGAVRRLIHRGRHHVVGRGIGGRIGGGMERGRSTRNSAPEFPTLPTGEE